MSFSSEQISELLKLPFVGKTVIQRLQEVGLDDVHTLANSNATEVLEVIVTHLHSSCWKDSPQATQSINNVIAWAKQYP